MNNEIGRKITSLTLMTIMLASAFSAFAPSAMPEAAAANANLYVSAENSQFQNYFAGPQVIEVVVIDSDIKDTDKGKGEPDVTINGKKLRMIQATDGNWYGYFADRDQALLADSLSSLPGKGLDFGKFCSSSTTTSTIGISLADTAGFAIPRSNGVTGAVDGAGLGSPALNTCISSPVSGTVQNHVTRATQSINPGGGGVLPGQIGLDVDAWPFIQLYSFSQGGNVVVQYNKGGGVQTTTLTFDTVGQFATHSLDSTSYRQNANVYLTLTDPQLNIDPTDIDSWSFGTNSSNPATFYQLFDKNGLADADGTAGAVPILLAPGDMMFENNGVLKLYPDVQNSGINKVNLADNNDQMIQPQSDISLVSTDGGSMSAGSQPVTLTELSPNAGIFGNYDEFDGANIVISSNALGGQSA